MVTRPNDCFVLDCKAGLIPASPVSCRVNLPKLSSRGGSENEEGELGAVGRSPSSETLDTDGGGSSEVSFGYEFAQTEVMMKALGNDGECSCPRTSLMDLAQYCSVLFHEP